MPPRTKTRIGDDGTIYHDNTQSTLETSSRPSINWHSLSTRSPYTPSYSHTRSVSYGMAKWIIICSLIAGILGTVVWMFFFSPFNFFKKMNTGGLEDVLSETNYNNGFSNDSEPQQVPYPGAEFSRGSEGNDILIIQEALKEIAQYYQDIRSIEPDGKFGSATEAAVIEFQERFGLKANGIVGINTWNKLMEILAYPPSEIERRTMPSLPAEFVTIANLNLREYPSTEADSYGAILTGEKVKVIDYLDYEWYFVEYGSQKGYMKSEFLTEVDE